jgi:hypothetical protein
VNTFEPALLRLDRHLDDLQVVLLGRTQDGVQNPSEVHNSLCITRGILSEIVQALG